MIPIAEQVLRAVIAGAHDYGSIGYGAKGTLILSSKAQLTDEQRRYFDDLASDLEYPGWEETS